jgi:hypothetical protein
MNKLHIVFLLLLFSNCKNETPQYSKNLTPLFDLKGFLDNEIATHLKDVKKVKKTVTVNGKTETKEVVIKDWKEELKLFFNSDINRPAWRDKYFVTSQGNKENGDFKTDFTVVDNDLNLKTRYLGIAKSDILKYSEIKVWNYDQSVVSHSDTYLYYKRIVGQKSQYHIITKQKLVSSLDSIKIEVEF